MSLNVDVFSDIICPWCYVGKRRLEAAIATFETSHPVQVHWQPFQLNPQMPKAGISRLEYRAKKFGSLERSMELDAKMIAAGEAVGIHFVFDRIERTPNTLDAHRLIALADQQGVQDSVVEGLFLAYFCHGQDISNRAVLTDVVAAAGLDRDSVKSLLEGNEGMNEIRQANERVRQLKIEGVPFFIVNQEITFSGAQPPETFLAAFRHANASA